MARLNSSSLVAPSSPVSRTHRITELADMRGRLQQLFQQIYSASEPSARELATCQALMIMGSSSRRHLPISHRGVKKAIGQRLASMLQGEQSDQDLAQKVLKTYAELQIFATSGFLALAAQ